MVGGRQRPLHDEGKLLAIRTDFRGKEAVRDHDDDEQGDEEEALNLSRTTSLTSLATSTDEQNNTHLSASSAGNTEISSSALSANSTAHTSTMTDDDRPSTSSPMSPTEHAHPDVTILELVSNTASSSALPDSFSFNVSRKGNYVAVYTASNIWLIKAAQLPRLWARTLEVKRKPVAIDITEDGFLLAVLSRPSQVDLYEIHAEADRRVQKRRTIMLVHEASSLVISPDGLILIAGNKFGIEVVAVGPDVPETLRRSLSGPVGDVLEFSDDGRTLLITSYARKPASSFVFVLPGLYDGPLDDEGVPLPTSPESAWTGTVLFPETAKIARQATLLPDADTGQVNELFAFNAEDDTWGVYDVPSQRFTQRRMFLPDQQRWTRSEFIDDAMPAVSPNADLAAVALRMRGTTSIWLYQIPEWDLKPDSKSLEQSPIQPCFCIPIIHEGDAYQEISELRWVRLNSNVQRLVAVGNLSIAPTDSEGHSIPPSSKAVMIVLDFDRTKASGSATLVPAKMEYDLDPLCPGERLPEGLIDFEREVELVRTRTMAQRRAQDRAGDDRRNSRSSPGPGRANTTVGRERPSSTRPPPVPTITRDDEGELTMEEAQAAFEVPYDNQQPRSQMSLARAATVAAVSPANRRHLRALPFRPLEYRRADGMAEFPHESDADNWVPPPPTYTVTAEASHSVSLSHPDAPPVPATVLAVPGSTIPPVPPLPASMMRSQHLATNPYHGRVQSHSSVDLTLAPPQERRPSLLHPSTYPAPQPVVTTRRRSSTSQSSQRRLPMVSPPPPPPTSTPYQDAAYQATTLAMSTRRPTMRVQHSAGPSLDFRPPPVLDQAMRRGSAPDPGIHRRPVHAPGNTNRQSMPSGLAARSNLRRTRLPSLSTFGEQPPSRRDARSPKKKVGCMVM
ncbi:hypothetical protein K504DRAFT_375009 [Pleomassaria siparia CBS 279.74]|uniref:DUF7165 domain-containing protein n=1 Tax=Pleomassaria siparia CBS 279.74 TaxID=1314801 RepID=A0A6G1KG79_9PLEO|nr:hypothetical protein K504DRAFT_375009 [Pleomassaria siparia CBS 279.74]